MLRRLLSAVVVGFAAVVPVAGCSGSSNFRADLAFVSTRDGDYAVYAMGAAGGGENRLTEAADGPSSSPRRVFFQVEPAWSPDGRRIAFASRRAGTFDIYVMSADGTGTRRLTSAKDHDKHPTWSPDGSRIAFERGASDIYVMKSDGSDARRISDETVEEAEPAWSPDGTWIAYTRRTPGTPEREVWITRPNGSERHAVTSGRAVVYTPAWSPDSTRIVFTSNKDSAVFELYTVGVDAKGLRSVTPTVGDMFEPSWSPDGSRIAYSENGAIFTVELGGGDVKKLTDNENNDSSPAWNPVPPTKEE